MGAHSSKGRKKKQTSLSFSSSSGLSLCWTTHCHGFDKSERYRGRESQKEVREKQAKWDSLRITLFFKACYRNPSIDIQQFWGDCRLITWWETETGVKSGPIRRTEVFLKTQLGATASRLFSSQMTFPTCGLLLIKCSEQNKAADFLHDENILSNRCEFS